MYGMHNKLKSVIIFQGASNLHENWWVENQLPRNLSYYTKVVCFEYPQFSKLFKLILQKIPLIENKKKNLIIFHSFGLFPFGRIFIPINYINHIFNFFLFLFLIVIKTDYTNVITFTPELSFVLLFISNVPIIYYVSDDYTTLPSWKNFIQKTQFLILEKILLKEVQKVMVTSNALYQKYSKFHKQVFNFPIPADIRPYLQLNRDKSITPHDFKNIPHPVAGFIGSFYEWKIDTGLVEKILKEYKGVSFVFIGILEIKNTSLLQRLTNASNFYHIESKAIYELPLYVTNFDICLIPYKTDRYGQSAYPVKIMEYLALGKPVISTALPSVKRLGDRGLMYWSKNDRGFLKNIQSALNEKHDPNLIKRRILEAKQNDWNIRIKEFIKHIEE